MCVTQITYKNLKQKWVLIFSQDAYNKEISKLNLHSAHFFVTTQRGYTNKFKIYFLTSALF